MSRSNPILVSAAWLASLPGLAGPVQQTAGSATEAPADQAQVQPVWTAQECRAIDLLRSLRSRERPADEVMAGRLTAGGDSLLGLLFQTLSTRSVPAHDGGQPQRLSEIQENVILLAVASLDRGRVTGQVALELERSRDLGVRAAAVSFLGAVGRSNDLVPMFELALGAEETELDRLLETSLRRAVAAVLGRDPKAFGQLVTLRRITRPELLSTLVAAVGDTRDGRGLEFLSEIAYWHEERLLEVMAQVRLVGPSTEETVNDGMKNRLRPFLDPSRPSHCRAAILALTALRDHESIAPLIEVLSSEVNGLKEGALWALRELTGLKLASRESWARWHQAELTWLVREKPQEFRRLRSNEAADVADALRTILTHPLARQELCSALPDLLKNRWPAVRILACRTLAELAAEEAVPKLVWVLEDPTPEVAEAAHLALRSLTRLDLPQDPLAWHDAVESGAPPAEL